MAYQVFISHSSKDKFLADAVCTALEAQNIRCWIAPRDIDAGLEWSEAIVNGIGACRVMILIFSSNSNVSKQVHREVQVAFEKGVIVIPLRTENIVPTEGLQFFLSSIHWLDALTPPLEGHLHQLVETVQKILSEGRNTVATEVFGKRARSAVMATVSRRSRNPLALTTLLISVILIGAVAGIIYLSTQRQATSASAPPGRQEAIISSVERPTTVITTGINPGSPSAPTSSPPNRDLPPGKVLLVLRARTGQVMSYRQIDNLQWRPIRSASATEVSVPMQISCLWKTTIFAVNSKGSITIKMTPEAVDLTARGQTARLPPATFPTTMVYAADSALLAYHQSANPEATAEEGECTGVVFSNKPVGIGDKWSYDYSTDTTRHIVGGHAGFEVVGFADVNGIATVQINMTFRATDSELSSSGSVWIERSSGDIVKGQFEIENLPINIESVQGIAQDASTYERLQGNPIGAN